MKENKGLNQGQNEGKMNYYQIGKTLEDFFPEEFSKVLKFIEAEDLQLPLSMVNDFYTFHRPLWPEEFKLMDPRVWITGVNSLHAQYFY